MFNTFIFPIFSSVYSKWIFTLLDINITFLNWNRGLKLSWGTLEHWHQPEKSQTRKLLENLLVIRRRERPKKEKGKNMMDYVQLQNCDVFCVLVLIPRTGPIQFSPLNTYLFYIFCKKIVYVWYEHFIEWVPDSRTPGQSVKSICFIFFSR